MPPPTIPITATHVTSVTNEGSRTSDGDIANLWSNFVKKEKTLAEYEKLREAEEQKLRQAAVDAEERAKIEKVRLAQEAKRRAEEEPPETCYRSSGI